MDHQLERSLIATDRQKKPLHHNETGMECRGGTRGLSGLPWMAAEVPEGYFSGQGFPQRSVGSNPMLGSAIYSNRARRNPDDIQV